VFIIVRAISPCTENTQYSVSVSRSKEVPVFGPPVPPGATFPKGKHFADFILAKVINAENAAHRSEKFATMATRTRQEYLKDLANNYSSTTFVETGQKFCESFCNIRSSSIFLANVFKTKILSGSSSAESKASVHSFLHPSASRHNTHPRPGAAVFNDARVTC
jgi:hypothetical protein